MQGQKAKLSQHARELRTIIAWQGAAPWASQGRPGAGGGLSVPPSSCVVPTALSRGPARKSSAILQHRMVLDYLLAGEGGVCGKLNVSNCCLEIDDVGEVVLN